VVLCSAGTGSAFGCAEGVRKRLGPALESARIRACPAKVSAPEAALAPAWGRPGHELRPAAPATAMAASASLEPAFSPSRYATSSRGGGLRGDGIALARPYGRRNGVLPGSGKRRLRAAAGHPRAARSPPAAELRAC